MSRRFVPLVIVTILAGAARLTAQERPAAFPGEQTAVDAVLAAGGHGQVDQQGRVHSVGLHGPKVTDAVVASLAGLQRLRYVNLSETAVTDASLATLATCPNLICIELAKTAITDAGLKHLAQLKRLEHLDLDWTAIGDRGLEALGELPELQVLLLSGTRVSDEGLRLLVRFPKLDSVGLAKHLSNPVSPQDPAITDRGLETLSQHRRLKLLNLNGARITDEGLRHLSRLANLETLYLDDTRIGDAGMKHLAGLVRLESLWLERTAVSDAGLANVAAMSELDTIILTGTKITDAGLKHLHGLPKLRNVSATETAVSVAGSQAWNTGRPVILEFDQPPRDPKAEAAEAEQEALLTRFAKGDVAGFFASLKKYPDLLERQLLGPEKGDSIPFDGLTALGIAVAKDDLETTGRLLDRGAAIDRVKLGGVRSRAMTDLLIGRGADVKWALFWAQNAEVAKVLIRHGADWREIDSGGETPLHTAASDGRLDVVELLYGYDADLNGRYEYVFTPMSGGFFGQTAEPGPPRVERGDTPLSVAANYGKLEVVRWLLEHGARCDLDDGRDQPLHHAVEDDHAAMARLLLDHGAPLAGDGESDAQLLFTAISQARDIRIVRMLLDAGAPVNAASGTDEPAPVNNPFEKARFDTRGWTPLHYAAHGGYAEAVRLLIERGATVDARSVVGQTPLDCAAVVEEFVFQPVQGRGDDVERFNADRKRELERRNTERIAIRTLLTAEIDRRAGRR